MVLPNIGAQQQHCLPVGIGTACLGRGDMFRAQHGVAVELQQRVYDVPALNGERLPACQVMLCRAVLPHEPDTPHTSAPRKPHKQCTHKRPSPPVLQVSCLAWSCSRASPASWLLACSTRPRAAECSTCARPQVCGWVKAQWTGGMWRAVGVAGCACTPTLDKPVWCMLSWGPGAKTTMLAQLMQGRGSIVALDRSHAKVGVGGAGPGPGQTLALPGARQ